MEWATPEEMVIPVRFLGTHKQVDSEAFFEYMESFFGKRVPRFQVSLRELTVFPKWKKPRKLCVEIQKGKSNIHNIQKKLNQVLSEVGLEKVPVKQPLLTIGEWKVIRVNPLVELTGGSARLAVSVDNFPVTEIVLYDRIPNGIRPIKSFKLLE
eukprot:TRINITY_DN6617_c0_g1_i1.p1 TRINITY_DN6617_c0_g1~~TRINITY_DN6617_c0_g1_i1.p1  ORF type:complete len:154 (-),score=32.10 TRINITY_DN6617_c0_g1_i1:12-473(-)